MNNYRCKISLEDKSSSLFKRLIQAVILTSELLAGKTQQNSELRVMIRRNNQLCSIVNTFFLKHAKNNRAQASQSYQNFMLMHKYFIGLTKEPV